MAQQDCVCRAVRHARRQCHGLGTGTRVPGLPGAGTRPRGPVGPVVTGGTAQRGRGGVLASPRGSASLAGAGRGAQQEEDEEAGWKGGKEGKGREMGFYHFYFYSRFLLYTFGVCVFSFFFGRNNEPVSGCAKRHWDQIPP